MFKFPNYCFTYLVSFAWGTGSIGDLEATRHVLFLVNNECAYNNKWSDKHNWKSYLKQLDNCFKQRSWKSWKNTWILQWNFHFPSGFWIMVSQSELQYQTDRLSTCETQAFEGLTHLNWWYFLSSSLFLERLVKLSLSTKLSFSNTFWAFFYLPLFLPILDPIALKIRV